MEEVKEMHEAPHPQRFAICQALHSGPSVPCLQGAVLRGLSLGALTLRDWGSEPRLPGPARAPETSVQPLLGPVRPAEL